MADNSSKNLPVTVQLASNVAGALIRRFVKFETSSPGTREVITYVPGALGGIPNGILAESIDTTQADGFYASSMVVADGCYTEVLCGETWTQGAALRAGGNSSETDGAAYLANATGDIIIGYALTDCTAGNIGTIQFIPYGGLAA